MECTCRHLFSVCERVLVRAFEALTLWAQWHADPAGTAECDHIQATGLFGCRTMKLHISSYSKRLAVYKYRSLLRDLTSDCKCFSTVDQLGAFTMTASERHTAVHICSPIKSAERSSSFNHLMLDGKPMAPNPESI